MIVRMGSHPVSRSIAAACALAATAFLLAGCGGSDSADAVETTDAVATTTVAEPVTTTAEATTTEPTTAGPTTIDIIVKDGVPDGGIKRATVAKGDHVVLVVHSDIEDEVHLHGYNFAADVPAGGVARIEFVADVPGRFEVELEQRGVKIADLTVTP